MKLDDGMTANVHVCFHRSVAQLQHLVPGEIEKSHSSIHYYHDLNLIKSGEIFIPFNVSAFGESFPSQKYLVYSTWGSVYTVRKFVLWTRNQASSLDVLWSPCSIGNGCGFEILYVGQMWRATGKSATFWWEYIIHVRLRCCFICSKHFSVGLVSLHFYSYDRGGYQFSRE